MFATLRCTVNSRARKPEWSQLQLDLFLSLFGLVSSLALSALCIMYESVIQPGSHDKKYVFYFRHEYHSYYGMLLYVPVSHISVLDIA